MKGKEDPVPSQSKSKIEESYNTDTFEDVS